MLRLVVVVASYILVVVCSCTESTVTRKYCTLYSLFNDNVVQPYMNYAAVLHMQ